MFTDLACFVFTFLFLYCCLGGKFLSVFANLGTYTSSELIF
jgi:hypothetical protein